MQKRQQLCLSSQTETGEHEDMEMQEAGKGGGGDIRGIWARWCVVK